MHVFSVLLPFGESMSYSNPFLTQSLSSYSIDLVGDPLNDRISSVKYQKFEGVIFYQHSNFGGARNWYQCSGTGLRTCSWSSVGWWNDRYSSVSVGKCWRVTFYQHSNYGGARYTLWGETHWSNLSDIGWNDYISSLSISKYC
jgi:hypothetical protein